MSSRWWNLRLQGVLFVVGLNACRRFWPFPLWLLHCSCAVPALCIEEELRKVTVHCCQLTCTPQVCFEPLKLVRLQNAAFPQSRDNMGRRVEGRPQMAWCARGRRIGSLYQIWLR